MDEKREYGPAMSALTEKQRRFVLALLENPGVTQGRAAELAGYENSPGGMRVMGHYCAHHPGVQAALREEAGKRLNSMSVIAANVMMDIMLSEDAAPKDKLKAAMAVLDRTGFAAAQTINVNKTVTDRSGTAILTRLKELASKHGIDPTKLLRDDTPVMDGEFSEVGSD